jgi:prephenate dehydrogenase
MSARANVAGLGLIGGSVGRRSPSEGGTSRATTLDPARVDRAIAMGCIIAGSGLDPEAEITFVAVPVLAVADQVKRALAETSGVVTDVGSVKNGS